MELSFKSFNKKGCEVLIINSPLFRNKIENYTEDSLPPIGLGYIATNLQNKSICVELIDAVSNNFSVLDVQDIIKNKCPKFVGLNVFSTNLTIVQEIVETCMMPVNFLIGGLVTKHLFNEIVSWETENQIDVVIGEGDFIAYDIIANKIKEEPIYSSDKRRIFKVDKNSIYYPQEISDIPLNRTFFKNEPIEHSLGFTEANIITSRGCIHNCAFCGAAASLNRETNVRERSSISITDEICYLCDIYPTINSIRILDDLFLRNKDHFDKAIRIFSARKINWRSMAHIASFNNISEGIIKKLAANGCYEISTGIESGSVSILKRIHKTYDVITSVPMLIQ